MPDRTFDEPTESQGSGWHALGPHRYRLVGRFFWLETHGTFTAEHADPFLTELIRLQELRPDVGLYVDAARGVTVTPECRRIMAERSTKDALPLPMAVVGGSLLVRTVFSLLVNAIRLLGKQDIPIGFFRGQAEAMAWLEAQAAERQKRVLAAQPADRT
ncbi:MAG: hypothetical protein U1A78_26085 [Polyangia bacterium]